MGFYLKKLIESFSKFPSIGIRVATRFAFYIVKMEEKEFNEFIKRLIEVRKRIKICSFCFNIFEPEKGEKFCNICLNKKRDKTTICLVEKESDLEVIEKTNKYNGLYFILGGTIPLSKIKENKLRIKELFSRITKLGKVKEIIIATNFTSEGEATKYYLERKIKESFSEIKITRLSRGMPGGGEIEYADNETIEESLLNRK